MSDPANVRAGVTASASLSKSKPALSIRLSHHRLGRDPPLPLAAYRSSVDQVRRTDVDRIGRPRANKAAPVALRMGFRTDEDTTRGSGIVHSGQVLIVCRENSRRIDHLNIC